MNFEELVTANEINQEKGIRLPYGCFVRKYDDKKCFYIVKLREDLLSDDAFVKGLAVECGNLPTLNSESQIRFICLKAASGQEILRLERGQYSIISQMLNENPSLIAQKDWLRNIIKGTASALQFLHRHHVWQVCLSPDCVFVGRGKQMVRLLSHGSYYLGMDNPSCLYMGEHAGFVAPEVLSRSTSVDERCDVYAFGKFIEWLFRNTTVPYEYRKVIAKATEEEASERYASIDEMMGSMSGLARRVETVKRAAIALAVSLLIVAGYFELVPHTEIVEYVDPGKKEAFDDLLDKGFDEQTEFGVQISDSSVQLSPEEIKQMKDFERKAIEIFKKRYRSEATEILGKVYGETMDTDQKSFVGKMSAATEELLKKQVELANISGLTPSQSQKVAAEIIEDVTNELKQKTKSNN
ncbi:MAG: hypothetical protein ACI4BA_04335 [Prevotella sp.]